MASLPPTEMGPPEDRDDSRTTRASRPVRAPSVNFPRPFGRYILLREIGRGGMGLVYEAVDPQLDRHVALKSLAEGNGDVVAVERFQREARAVAHLRHPNIVTLHEVGEHCAVPYLTMDLVSGGTLADRLEDRARQMLQGRWDPALLRGDLELFLSVARAVGAAHEQGIIHRDLKPGNVLLDEKGTPFVSDFGLAKETKLDAMGDRMPSITVTGEILGTPGYMSPEQARGDTRNVSPRSDVFSLGAILYEILCGQRPFNGDSLYQVLDAIAKCEPAPPRMLLGTVPKDLETICLKCLDKDPARRYADARELAEDLARFLQEQPILARRSGLFYRIGKRAGRNRPAVALLLGLLLVLGCVAIAVPLWHLTQVRKGEDRLVEGRRLVDQGRYDDAIAQFELAREALGPRPEVVAGLAEARRRKQADASADEEIEIEAEEERGAAQVLDGAAQDLLVAFSHLARGDRDACVRKVDLALKGVAEVEALSRAEARTHQLRALSLFRLWQANDPRGALDAAAREYEAALASAPDELEGLQGWMEVRLATCREAWTRQPGKWSMGDETMEVRWEPFPERSDALLAIAKRAREVLAAAEEAPGGLGRTTTAHLPWTRGVALACEGKGTEALDALAGVNDPQDLASSARQLEGEWLLFGMGRPADATKRIEEAQRLAGDSLTVLVELAQARAAAGEWEDAAEAWGDALRRRPNEAVWRAHYGLALLAKDPEGEDVEAAGEELKRALQDGLPAGPLRDFVEERLR